MKIAFFSHHHFEKEFFERSNEKHGHELTFFSTELNQLTTSLSLGFEGVCCFVSDKIDAKALELLKKNGVRLIALRSAGYNNVDLEAAAALGLTVLRVPAYSPHAVAEYAVGLLLSLNRRIHRAFGRVRDLNFSLEGFVGFDLNQKTVGVIGLGRIGRVFAEIMLGFGCRVIAFDPHVGSSEVDGKIITYVGLEELYQSSDVISLHLPLTPETHHMIAHKELALMKEGAVLVNTGRGALIDTVALIAALKSGHLGGAALDVYEEEEGVFFKDLSDKVLMDDVLARLLTFPNVLITSHQAFLTQEALEKIANVTLQNITDFQNGAELPNEVHAKTHMI
ncbi:2-hydroxyacid dehydrogenase [bacterium]|nr:2-hydroxyacid dehydrogenase [bacterium]